MTEHDLDCGCQEYNELSRRQFLATSAGVSAAALFPAWLPKIVMSKNYSSSRDIIISIFQRGGADGLSIAVPFADPNYYTARPTIAIPRPDATAATRGVNLDGFFAFPQAMAGGTVAGTGGLMPAFQGQDLLIVHATGQLNNSRSHFDAQRYMEVGKPVDPTIITGWLGRHLASIPPLNPTAPLRAHRSFKRFAANARRWSADAADRRSDQLFHRRIERDAGGARRVPAGRLYRRCGSGRPLGPQRHEHDRPAQVGELHRLRAGQRRGLSERQFIRESVALGGRADQGKCRHRGGADRYRRLGHPLLAGPDRRLDVQDDGRLLELARRLLRRRDCDRIPGHASSSSRSSAATCARTAATERTTAEARRCSRWARASPVAVC